MCFDVRKKESQPLLEAARRARPGADPEPAASEDRGTPVWIWRDEDGDVSFCRPRRPYWKYEVSVPIGWSLKPRPEDGVVLANVFGYELIAFSVMTAAIRGERGFKIRSDEGVWS